MLRYSLSIIIGLFSLSAVTLSAPKASMHNAMVGKLEISNFWVRATPPSSKTASAFMKVTNHGLKADKLMTATTSSAKKTELHSHINDDGVMRMRKVKFINIPMHGQAILQPGSYHIMMMGLKGPLNEGSIAIIRLHFARSGNIAVPFPVKRDFTAKDHPKKKHHNHTQ